MTGSTAHRWFSGRTARALAALAVLMLTAASAAGLTPPAGTLVTNTATATFSGTNGYVYPQVTSNTVSTAIAPAPILQISKGSDSDPVAGGAVFTYTLRYQNSGNAAATGVTVIDTLPADVSFQSASSGGVYAASSHTVTWNLGTLTAGNGGFLTVTVQARAGLPVGSSIVNNTSIRCAEGSAASATASTTIGAGPNMVLEKSGAPVTVSPNGLIHYTLSYRNTGNQDATLVRITDEIPSGTAYVAGSATSSGVLGGGVLTWNLGTVPAGSRGEVGFQVRVSPIAFAGQQISNTASILGAGFTKASNTVLTTVSTRSLLLLKMDKPDPVRAGNDITYTLHVENTGSVPLTGVVLSDPFPAGVTFVSADSGGIVVPGVRQVDWPIGNLAVGQKLTVKLTVNVDKGLPQGHVIENIATVKANETTPQTVRAVTGIDARTPGAVAFFDGAWQPSYGYLSGDAVYIQVRDLDQNRDPLVAETVTVVLTDEKTGDTETLVLTETGPDTGLFRNNGIPTSLAVTPSGDGRLTVAANSRIRVTYTDPLDAAPVSMASALIDPLGIVFDAVTGTPVSGVVVTLRNWNALANACDPSSWPVLPPGQINPAAPTGADGKFAFPLVPPGDFCFEVKPIAGYTFPSQVPNTDLPAGFTIGNGSRGEKFTLNVGDPPLIRDIPLDPPAGRLTMAKTATKTAAAVGDLIGYSLKLTNAGAAPVRNLFVTDTMPHGIQYLTGSSRLDGNGLADPRSVGRRTWVWDVGSLQAGSSLEITYRAAVGPDAQRGDGVNTVSARGVSLGTSVSSNTASVKVKITAGVFTEKGTIIGKVFVDRNGNRMQDQGDSAKTGKPDEPGVPDVALYLEDGTRVITDESGKYSIVGVLPGTHVLRVDETTLPKNTVLVPLSNRFLGDGASQFVDMNPGGLFKADFAVQHRGPEQEKAPPPSTPADRQPPVPPGAGRDAPPEAVPGGPEATGDVGAAKVGPPAVETAPGPPSDAGKGEAPGLKADPSPLAAAGKAVDTTAVPPGRQDEKTGSPNWEEAIKTMTPELAFLSPADGQTAPRSHIRVLVKAPLEGNLTLSLNGVPVSSKQIGRKIDYGKGRVTLYEYIDVRLKRGEENLLKAEFRDPFGNLRGTKQISLAAAGAPERIAVKPDKGEIPADGVSRVTVSVSVLDSKGVAVPDERFATVSVSAGEILEKDADPVVEEHQIPLKDGRGAFTIQAPRETGEAEIIVAAGERRETVKLFFVPHLRDLFMVGMGELKIGRGQGKGDYWYLNDKDWFDDGFYKNGRGAFFMKGKFFDDFLITAAYDSDKKKRDDLFRENDTTLDTEDKYPIYGDESKTGYEALSADKLYVKIEKNRSYLLYGDYKTDLNDARLAAYNRSFTGLKFDLNTQHFKIRSFGSYTDQTQIVDTLPGKGISGYYYLTKRPIVEGSERVVIEVRDRYRPDNVLSRTSKARGSDYEIDYDQGALLFKEPIASHDSDYNPVYVVASYESKSDGEKYYVYGGRGAFKVMDALEIGATGVIEEKAIGNYQLLGADLTLTLPRKTVVKAEYAQTRAVFEENSLFSWRSDQGWSFGFESEPLNRLRLTGYYRTLGDYFMNTSAVDVSRGTSKYGFDVVYALRPETSIKGQFFNENDDLNDMRHRLASIGLQTTFRKTKFSAEISNESSSATYIAPTLGTTRSPFDVSQDLPHELTAAKVAMETELREDLSLNLSHKHNLGGDSFHTSQAGLNYQINKQNRLYLREEYQKYLDRSETRTLFGAETQMIRNTVAFNEYRLGNGADGARNQSVIGLRNKFLLGKDVTGNAAAEYLRTVSGSQRQGEPDAVALSLGLEYLARKNTKISSRFEHRRELVDMGRDSYLGEVGVAYKFHPDYSLLLRERYFTEDGGTTGTRTTSRTLLGLAYRPLLSNRFNALTKLEYKHDTNSGTSPTLGENAYIFSGEGVWQATPRLQLTGKYAGKLVREGEFSSYTDLVAARFLYDLTDRWDVGAEYRLLSNRTVETCYHGGAVEIGYRVIKNLWASIGYSFDRFDADLTGDGYQGDGPYLKLRFKFDETLFKGLRKNPPQGDTLTKGAKS